MAGQSAVDAIGEAPAPMDVEVPNRAAADVMDEEENVEAEEEEEEEEVVAVEEKEGERPARRPRTE